MSLLGVMAKTVDLSVTSDNIMIDKRSLAIFLLFIFGICYYFEIIIALT